MAYLSLTEQVRGYAAGRARKRHEESRFPSFRGPNYDLIPDQDRGGILFKTFQARPLLCSISRA